MVAAVLRDDFIGAGVGLGLAVDQHQGAGLLAQCRKALQGLFLLWRGVEHADAVMRAALRGDAFTRQRIGQCLGALGPVGGAIARGKNQHGARLCAIGHGH